MKLLVLECHEKMYLFVSFTLETRPLSVLQENNVQALDILFTYHGSDLLPHRLAILSNFPETTSPHEYSVLLPEAWYVTIFNGILSAHKRVTVFCFMPDTFYFKRNNFI